MTSFTHMRPAGQAKPAREPEPVPVLAPGTKIRIYGAHHCGGCVQLKRWLDGIPSLAPVIEWRYYDDDIRALAEMKQLGIDRTPSIAYVDDQNKLHISKGASVGNELMKFA